MGMFFFYPVFLIPSNKLNSAALKRSEEGNDWPQKILLSPYLTINSWQTVYTSTPQNATSYFNKGFGGRLNVSKMTVFISVHMHHIPLDKQKIWEGHILKQ